MQESNDVFVRRIFDSGSEVGPATVIGDGTKQIVTFPVTISGNMLRTEFADLMKICNGEYDEPYYVNVIIEVWGRKS